MNTEGENLFLANCHTCHSLDKVDNFLFESLESRGPWTDRKKLIAWIKDQAGTYKDLAYTKQLVQSFNGQIMPSFPNLTDAQIESILDYIKRSTQSVGISAPAVFAEKEHQ